MLYDLLWWHVCHCESTTLWFCPSGRTFPKKNLKKSRVFHSVPVWEMERKKKSTKKAADSFRTTFKGNFKSSGRKNESLSFFIFILAIRKLYGCLFPHIPKLPCNWVRYCAIFFSSLQIVLQLWFQTRNAWTIQAENSDIFWGVDVFYKSEDMLKLELKSPFQNKTL